MATQTSLDLVQKLYVAYYGRPADPSGQQYWAEQIDEQGVDAVINYFGNSPEFDARFGSMSNEQLVNNLYFQLFGRSAEQEGLDFYVGHLEAGNLTLAEIAQTIAGGAQNEDATALENKLAVAQSFTDAIDEPNEISAYQGNDAANTVRQFMVNVDEGTDPSAVDVDGFLEQLVKSSGDPSTQNVFTLTEIPSQTETTLMVGTGQNAVPADMALAFLQDVAQLDLVKEGLLDSDGNLTSGIGNITIEDNTDGQATININTADGDLLSLAFDGNLALLAQVLFQNNLSTDETTTQTGIVLTQNQNNGGAFESGYTTSANDLIVAGRPELLHGAYIDGGGGYNVLEVDMKGVFAQPFQLKNIQEVQVQNLPNVYDLEQTIWADEFNFPNVDSAAYDLLSGSTLDLSRARELEKVVINEAQFNYTDVGPLSLTGIEGSATARLEGNFTQDVNLFYGRGLGDAVELELANVTMSDGSLVLGHNAGTVNLLSEGRLNVLQSADFGEFLRELNISGSGELAIQDDLSFAFGEVTIDASENTGGLRLSINDDSNDTSAAGDAGTIEEVTIKGSQGRDVIELSGTKPGVYLDIDTGEGRDTLILNGVDAGSHSSIQGDGLTIRVENDGGGVTATDLTKATLNPEGLTHVIIDAGAVLRLTQQQATELGADKFLAEHAHDDARLEIVINEDTNLSDVMDLAALNSNVKLSLVVEKGATLTLTAEELHKYVAESGIQMDNFNGKVEVTDAGLNFNVGSQNGIYQTGGTITPPDATDLSIVRSEDGFQRPEPDDFSNVLTIDTTDTGGLEVNANVLGESTVFTADQVSELIITGSDDITFNAPVLLGDDFTIDFSGLEGELNNLTVLDFHEVEEMIGNGAEGVRINVELDGDVAEEGPDEGLLSTGVAQYVVTNLNGDDRTFNVCDKTQGIELLGLKGNQGNTLTFNNVPWGMNAPEILLEGDGKGNWDELMKADGNPDASNVGGIIVDYFAEGAGAPAVVNINNAGVEPGLQSDGETARPIHVESIEINNARSLEINAEDGNVEIADLDGDFSDLTINGEFDVTLTLDGSLDLDSLDASDVAGDMTLVIDGTVDLADTELSGIDSVVMEEGSDLTLTIEQVQAIGAEGFSLADGVTSADLNIGNYDGSEFDFSGLGLEGINVGTVTVIEGEDVVVDPATDFTGINQLVVPEGSNVTMTAEQFKQLVESGATIETQQQTAGVPEGTVTVEMDGDLTIGDDDETTIDGSDVTFAMSGGEVLNVETFSLANGLQVTGDADADTKALVNFLFDTNPDTTSGAAPEFWEAIEVGAYQDVDLRIKDDLLDNFGIDDGLGNIQNSQSIEDLLGNLDSANILNIYRDIVEVELDPRDRLVVVEPEAMPEGIEFSAVGSLADYVRSVDLTLQASDEYAASIEGAIFVNDGLVREDYTVLTINTEDVDGAATGPVTIGTEGGVSIASDGSKAGGAGELVDITINADVDLDIDGEVVFSSASGDNTTATLALTGDADVEAKALVAGANITTIDINTTGYDGTLNVTGGSAALSGGVETLNLEGDGDVVIGSPADDYGVIAESLGVVNAADLAGDLTVVFGEVNSESFSFTGGTGVNTVWVADVEGADAPELDNDGSWSFDLSEAAAGSALRITDDVDFSNGGDLTLSLGDAVLEIDGNVDFRDLDNLVFEGDAPTIELLDGATVRMTDEQFEAFEAAGGIITGDTVIEVTSELLNDLGDGDSITDVRGATELQVDNGLPVTMTGDQALITRVYDSADEDDRELGDAGALGDATVDVVVAEDIDLTPVSDMNTLTMLDTGDEETFITVQLTAVEASQLVGQITRENEDEDDNALDLIEVPTASGDFIDPDEASFFNGGEEGLTAAVADGAQDSYDLSEVNSLVLDGDIVLSNEQLDQLFSGDFEGEIVKSGSSVTAVVTSGANLAQYSDNVDLVELVDASGDVTLSVDQAYAARVWDVNPYENDVDVDTQLGERGELDGYTNNVTVIVDADADLRDLTLADDTDVIQIQELETLPAVAITEEQLSNLEVVTDSEADPIETSTDAEEIAAGVSELTISVSVRIGDDAEGDEIVETRDIVITNDDGTITAEAHALALAAAQNGDQDVELNALLDETESTQVNFVGTTPFLEQDESLDARGEESAFTFSFVSGTVDNAEGGDFTSITDFQAGDGTASDDVFDILDFSAFFDGSDFEAFTSGNEASDATIHHYTAGSTIDLGDIDQSDEFEGFALFVAQDAGTANIYALAGNDDVGTEADLVQIVGLTNVDDQFVAENFGIA